MLPAIFLDRDGVIIENRPAYVRNWNEVDIYPQALSALAKISNSNYKVIIISNQAGIGRGLIDPAVSEEINERLLSEVVKAGGRIDGVFICPHKPEDQCTCRKPKPGLILQAAEAHSIDLSRSIMIGDAITDLQAGFAAGIPTVALVQTGRGSEQASSPEASSLPPFLVYADLLRAIEDLVR